MSTEAGLPQFTVPPIDPRTNQWNRQWWLFFNTLWKRTGSAQGASIDDWMANAFAGTPTPDLTAIDSSILAVEAMAAQLMAAATQKPDERGEAGDASNLSQTLARMGEFEAKAEAGMPSTGPFDYAPTTTTAPSAGAASALPATPSGYVTVLINGAVQQIPYY